MRSLGKTGVTNGQPTLPQAGPKVPGNGNGRLQAEGCFGSRIPALLSAGEPRNIPALDSCSRERKTCGIRQLPARCPGREPASGLLPLEMRLVK